MTVLKSLDRFYRKPLKSVMKEQRDEMSLPNSGKEYAENSASCGDCVT